MRDVVENHHDGPGRNRSGHHCRRAPSPAEPECPPASGR
jgi:hypothetical protein